jgi:hypothetical protein
MTQKPEGEVDLGEIWSSKRESNPNRPRETTQGFSEMWKIEPEPRIKAVIARDTTCSVSLLTGTICGSNFAIPSTKIPFHGNGTENSTAV